MLKFFSMILIFCFSQQMLKAQDVIYKKGGKKMEVKIKEIGMDDIKYVELDDQDGVIRSIAKDAVEKIKYENGKVEEFVSDFDNPEFYADQKNKAIKINFFSPMRGFTELAYEQNLAPGRSIEAKMGIIGLGFNKEDRNPGGFYGGFSYKFYRTPDHYLRGMRYAHILKGGYVRPEIVFGGYSEDVDKDFNGSTERRNVTFGAVMINLGKQWVFSDAFLLDLYVGGGYGFDSTGDTGTDNFTVLISEVGFAGQFGFRIGVLLK